MTYKEQLLEAMRSHKQVITKIENVPIMGTVYIRKLTVAEVAKQADALEKQTDKDLAFVLGVASILCDENGKRVFDLNNQEEMSLIASVEWDSIDIVQKEIKKSKDPKA